MSGNNSRKSGITSLMGLGLTAGCFMGVMGLSQAAQATLIHEYSFNAGSTSSGTYTTPDSVGGAAYQATIMGTGSISNGQVVLTNNNVTSGAAGNAYVSLPVSALPTTSPTVSFEEWFTASYDFQTGTSGSVYAQNRGFDFNGDTLATATDAIATGGGATAPAYLYDSLDRGNGGPGGTGISPSGYGS